MRKSTLRLYAPFIALAMLQAAFVIWAPSRGESTDPLSALQTTGTGPGFSSTTPGVDGGTQTIIDPTTGATITVPGGSPIGGSGSTGNTTSPGASSPGGTTGSTGGTTPAQQAGGDTSHCRNGRQTDVISTAPVCIAKFSGNNGGATYPGVTADEIKMVLFECQPNEQVNAILATQGLAATQEETDAMVQADVDFINANYETYGRKIVWEHVIGDCTLTPPDPPKSRQAAAEVAKTKPMFIIHYAGGPTTHDVWAQNGIVSLGGPTQDNAFFAGRRPFRWDIFPNGTETATWIGEYVCKKLAGQPASHAGRVIHPQVGGRTTPRKFGVLTFDNGDGNTLPNAQNAARLIEQCSGQSVPVLTYESDINRAEEQTRATVAKLVSEKVTSLVCLCDAIAPVFLTNGMTRNNYFPEHILSGAYLTDYDVLGRLYDPAQWQHAFGPSQLAQPVEFENSDAAKLWRASGRDGLPCASCNLVSGYIMNVGSMIHNAGPNLNPLTVEQALVGNNLQIGGWAVLHDPSQYFIKYGKDDYTAISDFREVYWSPTATSKIDGKQGAYIGMNEGRRYTTGELNGDFTIPVPSA